MQLATFLSVATTIAAAPLLNGIIKNCKAKLQNRRGPGLLQGYADLYKWLQKDTVVSPTTSWIFNFAPYCYFLNFRSRKLGNKP